ncbi:hypothetical protein N9Z66_01440, partial [bacterium]|nr:hypothetical protein [bacterium]
EKPRIFHEFFNLGKAGFAFFDERSVIHERLRTSWVLEKRSRVGFAGLDFEEACSAGLGAGVLF